MKYLILMGVLSLLMCTHPGNNHQEHPPVEEEPTDLLYLVREPKDPQSPAPVLILLHGYGSNENDLFSFSSQIPDHWLVVSVRGPIAISKDQFKWFDVKRQNGKMLINVEDEQHSRKLLLELIDQVLLKYKANKNEVVVAGFSQGAAMSLSLTLMEPERIMACASFSGRVMEEIKPLMASNERLATKQVFISHGTEDQMLPLRYAEENRALLEKVGVSVTLSIDAIGHSISSRQLNEFVAWMNEL